MKSNATALPLHAAWPSSSVPAPASCRGALVPSSQGNRKVMWKKLRGCVDKKKTFYFLKNFGWGALPPNFGWGAKSPPDTLLDGFSRGAAAPGTPGVFFFPLTTRALLTTVRQPEAKCTSAPCRMPSFNFLEPHETTRTIKKAEFSKNQKIFKKQSKIRSSPVFSKNRLLFEYVLIFWKFRFLIFLNFLDFRVSWTGALNKVVKDGLFEGMMVNFQLEYCEILNKCN